MSICAGPPAHSSRQWVPHAAACRREGGARVCCQGFVKATGCAKHVIECWPAVAATKAGCLQAHIHNGLRILGAAQGRPGGI